MARFSVDFQGIEEIKREKEFLNSGKEGACYFLDSKTIIKLFHILRGNRKINFKGYKSNNIAFPIDIYYYDDTNFIEGYTMNYLKGMSLSKEFDSSLLIDDLKNAYNKIRIEIENYPDIYMDDLVSVNILYDYNSNNFNIIDTSKWYKKKDAKLVNISRLNAILIDRLLEIVKNSYKDIIEHDPKLNLLYQEYNNILMGFQYLEKVYNPELFLEFVDRLVKIVNNYNEKVETIGDLKPKVLKKS